MPAGDKFRSTIGVGETHRHSQDGRLSAFIDKHKHISVPQKVYLHWVREQLENEKACLELPITIVLLFSFSFLALYHANQNLAYSVEQGIERDIIENANFAFAHYFGHKNLFDVHSFADFWSWVRIGFIPLVIQPTWTYSETYAEGVAAAAAGRGVAAVQPPATHFMLGGYSPQHGNPSPVRGDYLRYNRIVGGIRFRQQVAPAADELCLFPSTASRETWLKWYGKPCSPAYEELAFNPTSQDVENFVQPERIEWMYLHLDSLEAMIAKAVDMEDGCQQLPAKQQSECLCKWCAEQSPPQPWFDERTQRIELAFASYNPDYGLMTLSTVNFFINRGGTISKHVEIKSSWVDQLARPMSQLIVLATCDIIWLGLLLYIFVLEVKEIWHVVRGSGSRWYIALKEDYIAFWNVVDWISFLVAVVVVILFVSMSASTRIMHDNWQALMHAETAGDLDKESYATSVDAFYFSLEDVLAGERNFRLSLCIYPMMVMLRLFKSFAAQPRLAVVTETLVMRATDIAHFFVVFFSVLLCLCLDAVLIFGQDLMEFATFPRAVHTCFQMIFGDWDFASLEQIRRSHAGAWFAIFMLVIVVILFNIVLAIVMESYMEVKDKTKTAITLQKQVQEMIRRYKESRAGVRVRLNDILRAFEEEAAELGETEKQMMESNRPISAEFLMQNVPGIPTIQAIRTLKNAWDKETSNEDVTKLEDSEIPLSMLCDTTKQVRNDLFYIYERTRFYDTQGTTPDDVSAENARLQAVESVDDPPDGVVDDATLEILNSEIGRLSSEMASVLAQSLRKVDRRQSFIELRQDEMVAAVHEMQADLQKLQSEAYAVAMRMQRDAYHRDRDADGQKGKLIMPSCLECSPDLVAGMRSLPPFPSTARSLPQ